MEICKAKHRRPSARYLLGVNKYRRVVIKCPSSYEVLGKPRFRKKCVELLNLLEARSYRNNGETKWFDREIAKHMGCSIRSVQNYLKKLEEHKYITILTDVHSRKDAESGNTFYFSARVIRCNRVAIISGFEFKQKQIFEIDPRPSLEADGYRLGTPREVKFVKQPPWTTFWMEGRFDRNSMVLYNQFESEAEFGDERALKFLGRNFQLNRGDP